MKSEAQSNNSSKTISAAADSQTGPAIAPEQVVEQLVSLAATFEEVAVLTPEERRKVRYFAEMPSSVVEAQIRLIDTHERVEAAVGRPSAEARQIGEAANRWKAVEDQLRYMLTAVEGANRLRRQKLALIGAQAALVGEALAKDPQFPRVRAQMQEIRRLKRAARASRTRSPQQPSPADKQSA